MLSKQREEEHAEPSNRGAGFVLITERALTRHNHRVAQIDRQLAAIERELVVISTHCSASGDEFQEAVQRYRREYCEVFERALGLPWRASKPMPRYGEWKSKGGVTSSAHTPQRKIAELAPMPLYARRVADHYPDQERSHPPTASSS